MSNSMYDELDKLIKEYEEDNRTIKTERLVMKNYPKVLTMSAASLFEKQIKRRCQDFINYPNFPINTHYPKIAALRDRKPKEDSMYAKLIAYNSNGSERLDAENFYLLFGGDGFKTLANHFFVDELTQRIQTASNRIDMLANLLGEGEQYEFEYAKQCDLKEELTACSFEEAERAFLNLKLRRNRVAHDYIDGLSDTFEDILKFYNKAIVYVIALENAIIDFTSLPDQ